MAPNTQGQRERLHACCFLPQAVPQNPFEGVLHEVRQGRVHDAITSNRSPWVRVADCQEHPPYAQRCSARVSVSSQVLLGRAEIREATGSTIGQSTLEWLPYSSIHRAPEKYTPDQRKSSAEVDQGIDSVAWSKRRLQETGQVIHQQASKHRRWAVPASESWWLDIEQS